MKFSKIMFEKGQQFLINNFRQIINTSIFLILALVFSLLSTIILETKINSISNEIERLKLKKNNASLWIQNLHIQSYQRFLEDNSLQIKQKYLIKINDEKNSLNSNFFEEQNFRFYIERINEGPPAFLMGYRDLLLNYTEFINVKDIRKKIDILESYEKNFLNFKKSNQEELFRDLIKNIENSSQSIIFNFNDVHNSLIKKIGSLEEEKTKISSLTSDIVITIFLIQIFLYLIFQIYEVYTGREQR